MTDANVIDLDSRRSENPAPCCWSCVYDDLAAQLAQLQATDALLIPTASLDAVAERVHQIRQHLATAAAEGDH